MIGKQNIFTQTSSANLVLQQNGLAYEVKATAKQGTQLRATLRVAKAGQEALFELATIDLYSHRSRQWFAELCAKRFEVDAGSILEDLHAVIQNAEKCCGETNTDTNQPIEVSDTERSDAMKLLKNAKLMECIAKDLETIGYAGESINKQLAVLVAISRKLERPLSLLIESRSGAGKSALQDAVLSLVPKEDCLKYSRITDQALFYQAKDRLIGKLLAIEETAGMGGAAYSIRALQNGNALKVAATGKDPLTGRMKTEEYTVQAQTAVMMTTTKPDFDEETKSRFICATVNETPEMTRAILAMQRDAETIAGIGRKQQAEHVKRVHQNAQRLLRPLLVANPYAPKLTFPSHSLAVRRDNQKYLRLMKAVALLHQHQRETKHQEINGEVFDYIEATIQDIAIANHIAQDVLVHHHGVTPQALRLFSLVRKMLLNGGNTTRSEAIAFNRRRLREYTGWSDWQIRTHLNELVELEYVCVRQGRFGKEYSYELSDTHLLESLPGFGLTTDVDALQAALRAEPPTNLAVKSPNLEVVSANLAVH